MGNFACIKIYVLSIIVSLGFYKSNFRGVHIFADVLETRITRKYVQRENIYIHSISSIKYSPQYDNNYDTDRAMVSLFTFVCF